MRPALLQESSCTLNRIMKQRGKLPWALLIGCVLVGGCRRYHPDPQSLQQHYSAEVPLNSTATQVIAYLDAHRIAHSPLKHDASSGNSVEAVVSIPTAHALVEPSYDLVFSFSDQDRLTGYNVQYLGYIGY